MNREQENRPDIAEQDQAAQPEDPKVKFAQMLERARATGQQKTAEGERSKNPIEVANADMNGLIRERALLTQAAGRINKESGDQEQLQQIQQRMEEIDQTPGMMEYLQDRATDESPSETVRAEWEGQVRQSKEKAETLAAQIPDLKNAFALFPAEATVTISTPDNGNHIKVASKSGDIMDIEKLQDFLNQAKDVITPLPEGRKSSGGTREAGNYKMALTITENSGERHIHPKQLLKEVEAALNDAEKVE